MKKSLQILLTTLVPAVVLLLLGASRGSAQFEVPSRSFHNTTSFRLEGKHQTVACESCHLNGQFRGTPTSCFDCHWVRRKDDKFQTRLGTQCEQCHRPTAWSAVQWNHGAQTGFPLNANHRQLDCASCHRNATFRTGTAQCVTCHQKDYAATKTPNHASAGFSTSCDTCHQPGDATWRASAGGFNHNAFFPLVGLHATQACTACHKNGIYKGTSRDCAGCHLPLYNATKSPNHVQAGFSTACETCHRPTDAQWAGTPFNHNATFPLVGLHATQACTACHKNNVYKGTSRDCAGCHLPLYTATKSPNHAQAGFSTACDTCHKPTDLRWTGVVFNHNATFPLVGLHATQACTACHKNNVYRGTARDCAGCHLPLYTATKSPNHAQAGFSTACDTCHKPTDAQWTGVVFNHNATFPLVGLHATQACTACHKNNVYKGTSRDCAGCHLPLYTATKSPNHIAAGFPTTCDSCHKPTDAQWTGVVFNHNATFPLVGLHATQACTACHKNNVYKGTSRDCAGCHLPLYTATKSPNHTAAGFPTTCDSCHKPTDAQWTGVVFNHSTFALVGLHATQACTACHVNNVYRGTARTCVGCHLPVYNASKNPNHIAAGFPTTCDTCHRPTDSLWSQGTFTHTRFPLTGRHNVSCAQCHTAPTNFQIFSCTTCHARSTTDSSHRGRAGYVYDSNACYSCHPNGRAG